ncbi:flagellar basal-body rod protein FlgF [Jeotgalibacillus terrae]|uniref:Flagellar basal-body rod protein FlgF n=1 Tax=Jeotgalibacillus terrae TaxID=587735 RepID=A0ABW5ZL75_9BACL|nr:flagellar basal-body rod protein FlgF [Jeotgalibacillus terrae]MBM7579863.1 flagellar hook protein FlgE [Jeotgalibacillus terrae]
MIRSMYSGIAGLKNFQTKLDVIGNNIANVNTFGFKKGRVTFQEAMNQTIQGASAAQEGRGGKNALQVGLGSVTATIDSVQTQASLQTTGRSLDLAINGDGFFVVSAPGGQDLYTRGGNFYLDESGLLVTGEGYRVQQFVNGVQEDIVVNSSGVIPAQETNEMSLSGNLASNVVVSVANPFVKTQQMKIVDNEGTEHTVEVRMEKMAGDDTWELRFTNHELEDLNPAVDKFTTKYLSFNADGEASLYNNRADAVGENNPDNSIEVLRMDGTGAAYEDMFLGAPNPMVVNLENLTNNEGEISAQMGANGNLEGTLDSFSVSAGGAINAVYSNGQVREMATLSIARFNNPSGLVKIGNNVFQESVNSGVANVGTSADAGGTISSGALEMSNVDLSEEFTEMITAQRGFQANTRIITTSDQILEELVNLKR